MRWYSFIPENSDSCKMIYQRKCPPNNSVYEEWTTVGIEIETNKSNIQQIINQTFSRYTTPYLIVLND